MSFERYPKKQQLVSKILIKCVQAGYALDQSDYRIRESPISPE